MRRAEPVRPSFKHLLAGWFVLLVIFFAAVPTATFAARGWLAHRALAVDYRVRSWVFTVDAPFLERAAGWLDTASSTTAMTGVTLLAAICLWPRFGRASLVLIVAPCAAAALHSAAKLAGGRMRPPGGFDNETFSFPSGHTATATAVLVTLAFVLRRERLVSRFVGAMIGLLGPLLVALARVYRDVHWATDVIGGWAVGLLAAALAAILYVSVKREALVSRDARH